MISSPGTPAGWSRPVAGSITRSSKPSHAWPEVSQASSSASSISDIEMLAPTSVIPYAVTWRSGARIFRARYAVGTALAMPTAMIPVRSVRMFRGRASWASVSAFMWVSKPWSWVAPSRSTRSSASSGSKVAVRICRWPPSMVLSGPST